MANSQLQQRQFSHQIAQYIGPLPPSDEFGKYEKTLAGSADRILKMAEKEAEFRHKADEKAIKTLGRGQIFAFATTVLSLGAVVLSIFFSQPVASIAPTIVAITGLASIFLNRKL